MGNRFGYDRTTERIGRSMHQPTLLVTIDFIGNPLRTSFDVPLAVPRLEDSDPATRCYTQKLLPVQHEQ